jgi:hypothetical protein
MLIDLATLISFNVITCHYLGYKQKDDPHHKKSQKKKQEIRHFCESRRTKEQSCYGMMHYQ